MLLGQLTKLDLSLDARIKFCSDSIEEILGYRPNEVKGKSCWEYFHPDEIPFARAIHGRGLDLEKAAALNYCRIKHKDGSWIGCECVFTVVYDVLVASTAIYQRGEKAQSKSSFTHRIRCADSMEQDVLWKAPLSDGSFLPHHEIRGITCCLTYRTSLLSRYNLNYVSLVQH